MKAAAVWRAGSATDPGLERGINEDRVFVDEARGFFLVVDGLGGHAAGETAAQTAVDVIERTLRGARTVDKARIRKAITAANNQIFQLAEANAAWHGMACVLTLAVASGEQLLVGHVGDSRLYRYWNGKLQKLTHDHSPVGEMEDAGELTEEEAMRHPRRNEVFRDVGSYRRTADDPAFIEVESHDFPPDAALLVCSDGLTDLVKADDISRILERYDGDPTRIAQLLIEAANAAGGRDNISVVFVAGPEFLGTASATLTDTRSRHATTRMRSHPSSVRGFLRNILLLLAGMSLGLGVWRFRDRFLSQPPPPVAVTPAPHIPQEILVDAGDSLGIVKALAASLAGDSIVVPPGEYLGPLVLKESVNLVAQSPRGVIVRSDPAAASDAGIAIVARGVKEARIKSLHVLGDSSHPMHVGLLIADSSIEAEDIEIAGALEAGLRIEGDSHPLVIGGNFHANAGPGVMIRGQSEPRLVGNRIEENGRTAGALRPGIEIENVAQPKLVQNQILKNGLPAVFPLALDEEIRARNTVDPGPAKPAGKPRIPQAKPETPADKPIVKPHAISRPLTEA